MEGSKAVTKKMIFYKKRRKAFKPHQMYPLGDKRH
jgi:hypothetical protein